ncbi:hypothetical protein [Paraclostridium dentum]|uniref:hypothetical protein n=1 Tax=Paraclostridium dentum TaxID=2662455 RepID=UPI003F66BCF0
MSACKTFVFEFSNLKEKSQEPLTFVMLSQSFAPSVPIQLPLSLQKYLSTIAF